MEERRRFVRLDTRLPITYRVLPTTQAIPSATADIGGGGVCLFLNEVVKPGSQLQVDIKLPDRERSVAFTGEVVWCEQYETIGRTVRQQSIEAGVKFLLIDPKDRQAIMDYVILSLKSSHPA